MTRDLSKSGALFKSVINNTLKKFLHVECLCEEQKDCVNNMVNGKDVFTILPTGFGKSLIFQRFPRVMSSMNGRAGVVAVVRFVNGLCHFTTVHEFFSTKLKKK